ncbi:hypothetical protein [Parasphingorhabdus sp.]|uniref:hypothetical protein n=1 Tax=Parasphingorhabdus sp. TaxID=2709688 RepID=UPI00326608FD
MTHDHPVFADNPIDGEVSLSTGPAPRPYHVYDGEGLLIFGHADPACVDEFLTGEDLYPVLHVSGRVAAGFIIADFREASMGPHHELQFFILASQKPGETISDAAVALPLAMALRPEWGTLCVRLWNDTSTVVAYNNEYLGLNAELADFDLFARRDNAIGFHVSLKDGQSIIHGRAREANATPLSVFWKMLRYAGLRQLINLGRMPFAPGHVINRVSSVLTENRKAQIFTSSDHNVLRNWEKEVDRLDIGEPGLAQIDFQPVAVQNLRPFRFVYRHPDHPA